LAFLADFFGEAFLAAGLLDFLLEKACSQPSAYFWLVPTRVIVTAASAIFRGFSEGPAMPGSRGLDESLR
jgi:hypothetical protein